MGIPPFEGVGRDLHAAVLETMAEAVVVADRGGTVRYMNAAAHRILGPEFASHPVGDRFRHYDVCIPGQDAPCRVVDLPLWRALCGEAVHGVEARLTPLDDPQRAVWLHIDGRPLLDDEGRVVGGYIIVRDTTAARRAEAELEAARRAAEEANRTKDEFLAVVSHELKNPLSALTAWARTLQQLKETDPRIGHAAAAIDRNARALGRLIDDLLDLSRITTGKLRLDVRPVDLADIVRAALETLHPAAQAKNLSIQTLLAPGAVNGDPGRLQQVVWNLVSNAIKFSPAGARIDVSVRGVEDRVELAVADTGEGIEPALLPRIFDPFQQGADTTKRSGLGLGLSIVRHLVELHGGTIRADSAGPGLGATFTVTLPKCAPAETPDGPV